MKNLFTILALAWATLSSGQQAIVSVPAGADVGEFFRDLPEGVRVVKFDQAPWYKAFRVRDIVLPARNLEINGCGAELRLYAGGNGFTTAVNTAAEAKARISTTRYYIHDFAEILEGDRAIDLRATIGSVVERVKCKSQNLTAINLEWAMHTSVRDVEVVHPDSIGVYVGIGSWGGASATNSQSNKTILSQVRAYIGKPTASAFVVDNCEGVIIESCTSEGGDALHDIFFTASNARHYDGKTEPEMARNSTVKHFTVRNFHIEGHWAKSGSIYFNAPTRCIGTFDQVYFNMPGGHPIVYAGYGRMEVTNTGWWEPHWVIKSRVEKPKINCWRCHKDMQASEVKIWNRMDGKTSPISRGAVTFNWDNY